MADIAAELAIRPTRPGVIGVGRHSAPVAIGAVGIRVGISQTELTYSPDLEFNKELAMLTVGNKLPQFCVQACVGSTADDLCEITDRTYAGKWLALLFYPKDFTLICPTELVAFGEQIDEFTEREAVVLGGSTDNEYSHLAWRQSDPRLNDLPYPLIAAQKLAADLGILDPSEHVCLRATFLVDP